MKKPFIYALIAFFLGLSAGALAMLLVYPFIFPPAEVNERITDAFNKQIFRSGIFIHPNPSDPIHWGKGKVLIYHQDLLYEVYLTEDFAVGPGPDYHVYLSTGSGITSKSAFNSARNFELGKLKSFNGGQVYRIDGDIDLTNIQSVVIWCKAFGQLISSAELK